MPLDLTDKVFLIHPTDPTTSSHGIGSTQQSEEISAAIWCNWVCNAKRINYSERVHYGDTMSEFPDVDYTDTMTDLLAIAPGGEAALMPTPSALYEDGETSFIRPYLDMLFAKNWDEDLGFLESTYADYFAIIEGKFMVLTNKSNATYDYTATFSMTERKQVNEAVGLPAGQFYRRTLTFTITDTHF